MKISLVEDSDMQMTDADNYVEIHIRRTRWEEPGGKETIVKDFKIGGEIWRVHKSDPDPYPSNPHAHCVDGSAWLKGCKLHLGNRQLYRGTASLNRKLKRKQFDQLIEMIQPKFPHIELPLGSEN